MLKLTQQALHPGGRQTESKKNGIKNRTMKIYSKFLFRTLESQEGNLRLKPGKYLNKGQVVTQMFGKIKNCIK